NSETQCSRYDEGRPLGSARNALEHATRPLPSGAVWVGFFRSFKTRHAPIATLEPLHKEMPKEDWYWPIFNVARRSRQKLITRLNRIVSTMTRLTVTNQW